MDTKDNTPQENNEGRKKLDPENNKLLISARKNLSFYTFLAKIFLKKFEVVEMHALEQAVSLCTRLGERLQRLEFGKMTSIKTSYFTPE